MTAAAADGREEDHRDPAASGSVAAAAAASAGEAPLDSPPTNGATEVRGADAAGAVPDPVRIPLEYQDEIDAVVARFLDRGVMPGCVVAIGNGDGLTFLRAYGRRALLPTPLPMNADTVFDLASLTKPIVTATSLMLLVERGQVDLDAKVTRYLPGFGRRGKQHVTLRHLLTHTSGLPAVNPRSDYEASREVAMNHVYDLPLEDAPGVRFHYSDIGFIVLGWIVETITGESLETVSHRGIFGPLGMNDTRYLLTPTLRQRAAPTEERDDHWIQGDVHDPRAYRLGGVAGNAGLFSTARDLSRFARMMLNSGELDGVRVIASESVRTLTAPVAVQGGGLRGMGWDVRSGYSTQRGVGFSSHAYGHGGFTGTSLWIDPASDFFVIFLSNRVHPDGLGDVRPLAREIGTIAARASHEAAPLSRAAASGSGATVLLGIDALRRDRFRSLRGARVGLITNVSGRARDGRPTAELLAEAADVTLVALFAPEHGLRGDREGQIVDGRDARTGVPVHSLFGATRRPTVESLSGIDTMVFDVQDVGTRYYTYMSTMRAAMEAAAAAGVRFVVLDRPNPLGGERVEGPVLAEGIRSFVNHHPLPIRHGMTPGELAGLFRSERSIDVRLEVVRLEGWRRSQRWSETGLTWNPPSPNLRTIEQVELYPAVGILESTNLSVGRGTDMPFEVVGAPWMDASRVEARLAELHLPGVSFTAHRFVPRARPYRGLRCSGIRLRVTDSQRFNPVLTAVGVVRALLDVHPREWESDDIDRMLGAPEILRALRDGAEPLAAERLWRDELAAFEVRRTRYLLY